MATPNEIENYLAHYGVLGMKWGVRRSDAQLSRSRKKLAEGYSEDQNKRDKQVYGKRGANRINKDLKRGDSISVARGTQKTRRDATIKKNPYVRTAGKIAGAGLGVLGANAAISSLKAVSSSPKTLKFVGNLLKNAPHPIKVGATYTIMGSQAVARVLDDVSMRSIVSLGALTVASQMGGDAAVATNMRVGGYDPKRKY